MSPYSNLGKEIEYVHQKMRKWLERMSQHRMPGCISARVCWIPSADIHETEQAYHVFIDLAGVDASRIQLMVENNSLRLSGERQSQRVDSCVRIHQLEIDSGTFERIFQFPASLEAEGAQSNYRNGILEVVLPKSQKTEAANVKISLRSE